MHARSCTSLAASLSTLALFAPCAVAQNDPSGIEFIAITHPGNAPYQSIFPSDFVNGRGGVNYEYRLGKFEVTTAQWVEFFNAAYDRSDGFLPHLRPPDFWGAAPTTPNTPGGLRWAVPTGNDMRPVGDISWRMAAMYCNWLHNDKSADRSAFMNGAYDVSTFGFNGGIFTDQLARHPEARYWIPTWDEWLKAAHYDPNKLNGDGTTGGWWQYSNGSDTPYVYGPPGVGQANAGFTTPSPFAIPLGAYPQVQSPWGLYDMAGGTTEWTESIFVIDGGQKYRIFEGSRWGQDAFVSSLVDQARLSGGAEYPHIPTYEFGLRIASTIPSPGPWAVGAGALCTLCLRRKRGGSQQTPGFKPSRSRRVPAFAAMSVAVVGGMCVVPAALAQNDPSGIDFVTIGAVNNPAYSGPDNNFAVTGRGSVSYEYRIGRTEVTTAQWLEFYNLFYGRVPHVTIPARWGASDRGAGASPRFVLSNAPDAGLFPVSGASWRAAAMFCNWLHNDKSSDLSAVMNGAYDVSTFGYESPTSSVFTDQHTRHPDAKYWIPSLDEWIKAGFYDPNHGGQDVGGWWWNTPAATNVPLIHGPPGQGQANTGFDLPGGGHYRIPLGAYPDVQSPWGLLDMAGATKEFTETVLTVDGIKYRNIAGSHWTAGVTGIDAIYMIGGEFPSAPSLFHGLRVAAAVPSPGAAVVIAVSLAGCVLRRRRC